MEKVIAPFVGFYPDFKHPFSVAESHNTALGYIMEARKEHGFVIKTLPECYGFVVKSVDGNYRFADRKDAYAIAKAAGQLKEDYPNTNALESYMLDYDGAELSPLWNLSERVCRAFGGLAVDSDIEI